MIRKQQFCTLPLLLMSGVLRVDVQDLPGKEGRRCLEDQADSIKKTREKATTRRPFSIRTLDVKDWLSWCEFSLNSEQAISYQMPRETGAFSGLCTL
jgi:hypothetical protein